MNLFQNKIYYKEAFLDKWGNLVRMRIRWQKRTIPNFIRCDYVRKYPYFLDMSKDVRMKGYDLLQNSSAKKKKIWQIFDN